MPAAGSWTFIAQRSLSCHRPLENGDLPGVIQVVLCQTDELHSIRQTWRGCAPRHQGMSTGADRACTATNAQSAEVTCPAGVGPGLTRRRNRNRGGYVDAFALSSS